MKGGGPRAAVAAFFLPVEAARLLWRERSLWGPAAVPFAISAVLLVGALAAVVRYAASLYAFVGSWIPEVAVEGVLEWLWMGPLLVLGHAAAALLFLLVAVAILVGAYLVASLVAAPFHEILSRRVEALVAGRVEEAEGSWREVLRDAARSVREELRRLTFFLAVQGALAAIGFLVPGAGLLTAPAMVLVTLVFLPLDYASYLLDRRRVLDFRAKRRWALDHAAAMLGYGSAAFVLCLVPGLNLAAMPVLVVGGTLLALRHPPLSRTAPARDARAESPTSS